MICKLSGSWINDCLITAPRLSDQRHFRIEYLSIKTFSIVTLSIKDLLATIRINDTQHDNTWHKCLISLRWVPLCQLSWRLSWASSVIQLSAIQMIVILQRHSGFAFFSGGCHSAKCRGTLIISFKKLFWKFSKNVWKLNWH